MLRASLGGGVFLFDLLAQSMSWVDPSNHVLWYTALCFSAVGTGLSLNRFADKFLTAEGRSRLTIEDVPEADQAA